MVIPPLDNELNVLDTLKVCDTVLFVISAAAGTDFGAELIDEWGNDILVSAFAQVKLMFFCLFYIFLPLVM